MASILYVKASPRTGRSKSLAVADAFLDAYQKRHAQDTIVAVDVFRRDLPVFDGPVLDAKYAILHGQKPSPEQARAWKAVEAVIDEFNRADKYVLAVPMWNFGIPYRLKQYIDILVQPGYTFSYSPERGYQGLVTGKRAFVAYARGGDYSAPEAASMDHQKAYLELILGFMGIGDVRSVIVQPTLMGGAEVAEEKLAAAIAEARKLAEAF